MKLKSVILGTVLVAGALMLFKAGKKFRRDLIHFVREPKEKNFDSFPPDIPKVEFESVDFV